MKESMIKTVFLGFLAVILIMPATATMVGAEGGLTDMEPAVTAPADGPAPILWSWLNYFTIEPCRVIDTRTNPLCVPVCHAGSWWIDVDYRCGSIPCDAKAVMINVAAVDMTGMGNFRAGASSDPVPATAMLNFGQIPGLNAISNAAAIPLDGSCASNYPLEIYISRATNFVIDCFGYYW